VAAVVILFFLAVGITGHEISRGLDARTDKVYVFVGIGGFLVFAAVFVQAF
jgi:hypothetical protein